VYVTSLFVHVLSLVSYHHTVGWYNRKPPGGPATVIAIADPVEHKRRRRTWDRGFSTVATKNYEEIITRNVRELVEQFEKREGQEVDLSKWLSYFS
jgi:cytochrome P450